jgi:hypothetical protein
LLLSQASTIQTVLRILMRARWPAEAHAPEAALHATRESARHLINDVKQVYLQDNSASHNRQRNIRKAQLRATRMPLRATGASKR